MVGGAFSYIAYGVIVGQDVIVIYRVLTACICNFWTLLLYHNIYVQGRGWLCMLLVSLILILNKLLEC